MTDKSSHDAPLKVHEIREDLRNEIQAETLRKQALLEQIDKNRIELEKIYAESQDHDTIERELENDGITQY